MTNNLFHGFVSYKVNCPCYKPSIDGEELNIAQANPESSPSVKIQKSTLTVSLIENDNDLEFILKLDTHFFETDPLQAKEWFANYQDWVFASFVLQTNAVLRLHQSAITISLSPTPPGHSTHKMGLRIGIAHQAWSNSPLLQKLGDLSFLNSENFAATDERRKILYKQYKTCLQSEDPIARYMLLYNLLPQINAYKENIRKNTKNSDNQKEIDKLIRRIIAKTSEERGEFIKNQETCKPELSENKEMTEATQKVIPGRRETIYTCLRNEIAHKRTHRILMFNNKPDRPRELTLDQTVHDIREYVGSLARIVQLAILRLTSQASVDSSE